MKTKANEQAKTNKKESCPNKEAFFFFLSFKPEQWQPMYSTKENRCGQEMLTANKNKIYSK